MTIYKCDICKKVIKDIEVSIGYESYFPRFSLCSTCGKPVIAFLKKNKLIGVKRDKKS